MAGMAGMVLDQGTFRERPARRDEERRASMVRAASARRLRYPDPDPARPNASIRARLETYRQDGQGRV